MAYDAAQVSEDDIEKAEEENERLQGFVAKLEEEAERRVRRRSTIETRWMRDLRQFHAIYDPETLKKIEDTGGSQINVSLTRAKTNALSARLSDLLFPTDERNWSIQPTPVPELVDATEEAQSLVDDARDTYEARGKQMQEYHDAGAEDQATAMAEEMQAAEEVLTEAEAAADELQETIKKASDKCDLMQTEIDDQLKACSYQAACRDAIDQGCKIGTGVIKGPIIGPTVSERWTLENGTFKLKGSESKMPSYTHVDAWGFFPDPDARRVQDGEGVYERHLMNRKQMRALARRPDVYEGAVRKLLKVGANRTVPSYLVELNTISDTEITNINDLFHVWEYTGPIETEELQLLADAFNDDKVRDEDDEIDPLDEIVVRVFFCQGEILSFALHPLDSRETIYSVFSPEEDEAGPYGYGVPYMIRDSNSVFQAAGRMLMDNAGIATGPQLVINTDVIEPQDGSWKITPRKIWKRKSGADPRDPGIQSINIDIHQQELQNIMGMAQQLMDEESAIPKVAQGEAGPHAETAKGRSLLMNSANTVFRRFVKNFDDNVTVPNIRRAYHWNMQFSEKEHIKGDYDVDARGSSVLLVREMQATNLIMIAEKFGEHPVYGKKIDHDELLAEIFRAHMIPTAKITKTLRQQKQDEQEEASKPSPEMQAMQAEQEARQAELDAKREIADQDNQTRLQIAQLNYDTAMMTLAEKMNMDQSKLEAMLDQRRESEAARLEATRLKTDSDERKLAVEVGMRERTGMSAGGSV